jgi:hypothetical protein
VGRRSVWLLVAAALLAATVFIGIGQASPIHPPGKYTIGGQCFTFANTNDVYTVRTSIGNFQIGGSVANIHYLDTRAGVGYMVFSNGLGSVQVSIRPGCHTPPVPQTNAGYLCYGGSSQQSTNAPVYISDAVVGQALIESGLYWPAYAKAGAPSGEQVGPGGAYGLVCSGAPTGAYVGQSESLGGGAVVWSNGFGAYPVVSP